MEERKREATQVQSYMGASWSLLAMTCKFKGHFGEICQVNYDTGQEKWIPTSYELLSLSVWQVEITQSLYGI